MDNKKQRLTREEIYSNKKIKEGFERRSNASTTNQIDHLIKQAQNKKDKK
jgi:hypothetical protein